MNIIILQSSPNHDGLTAACAAAAAEGAAAAVEGPVAATRQAAEKQDMSQKQAVIEVIRLNDLDIRHCRACEHGWGDCLKEHGCQMEDDFQPLHQKVLAADALVLVSPVYWGEMSESAKAFTDRLRRCEATRREGSLLAGKRFLAVAAAGGSGGGMITCLASMERWAQHVQARVFDLIPVNRWSRPYKLQAIYAAAQTMVEEMISGEA